jgi:hypothetical protein
MAAILRGPEPGSRGMSILEYFERYEGGSWGQGEIGNPEERERSPLEAATKPRIVKTQKIVCDL